MQSKLPKCSSLDGLIRLIEWDHAVRWFSTQACIAQRKLPSWDTTEPVWGRIFMLKNHRSGRLSVAVPLGAAPLRICRTVPTAKPEMNSPDAAQPLLHRMGCRPIPVVEITEQRHARALGAQRAKLNPGHTTALAGVGTKDGRQM